MDATQNFTQCTVLIAAADQKAIQDYLKDSTLFVAAASPTGQEPATVNFTSGPFSNVILDDMTAKAFPYNVKVRTADWQVALAGEGLQMIVPPIAIQN